MGQRPSGTPAVMSQSLAPTIDGVNDARNEPPRMVRAADVAWLAAGSSA